MSDERDQDIEQELEHGVEEEEQENDLPWLQPADDDIDEGWLSARTLFIAAGVFVVIFAGLLWVIYDQLAGDDRSRVATVQDLPVIEAPTEPHKVPPEDPGGAEIPGRDRLVLDAANGDDAEGATRLGAVAETPIERPSNGGFDQSEVANQTDQVAEVALSTQQSEPQIDAEPSVSEPAAAADPQPVSQTPAQTVAEPSLSAAQGRYLIQLGAFSSEERARRGWREIQEKFPNMVGDLSFDTEIATSHGRTSDRSRGAAGATRAEAARRCAALQAAGQGCLPIER